MVNRLKILNAYRLSDSSFCEVLLLASKASNFFVFHHHHQHQRRQTVANENFIIRISFFFGILILTTNWNFTVDSKSTTVKYTREEEEIIPKKRVEIGRRKEDLWRWTKSPLIVGKQRTAAEKKRVEVSFSIDQKLFFDFHSIYARILWLNKQTSPIIDASRRVSL